MSITLNEQGPTNLPSTGGTIPYTVAIHNNTNATITFDGWTEYLNSQGQSQGLIIFRTDVNIGAYATIYRYLSLNIASTVPNDTYNYWGRVALTYPVPVIDDDYFTFTKGIGDDGGPQVLDSEKPVIAEANIPQNFGITSAYPNPFNPETTIEFELPTTSHINLTIYNLQGEIVAVLLEGDIPAGQYGVKWNASNFAAGTYIYLLKSDSWSSSGRLVLVK
jgi:hypothetical protein